MVNLIKVNWLDLPPPALIVLMDSDDNWKILFLTSSHESTDKVYRDWDIVASTNESPQHTRFQYHCIVPV